MVFALAPLLCAVEPRVLLVLCDVVFAVQTLAMTFLSVEICYERRLPITEVMPVNFGVFAVCACPSMLLLGAFGGFFGDPLACSVFTALGVSATVALIPALPSSSSTASVFALRELPENESYEARSARTREDMAARYGFSPRECEVFELLVQGKTRAEIAEQLFLSAWTVKQYTASIYAKVGVHSAKELMDCVARG